MATLILSTVGTIVGGPIGGAIGALAGQAIDRRLLRPGPRQGPRLTELAIQTSSYGSEIAHVFGTMRVAGTVIWATDLIETRSVDGGGKGAPDSVRYNYSASFAVLLSGRPVRAIGRIWADGKLLRGAGGDWKAETRFRLHRGGEDQVPDPLIASAVGIDRATAMRGQAYAVFEGLALADFGNRIPSLTFEVIADALPLGPATIAAAIGGGQLSADAPLEPLLTGFSAYGGTRRGVIETLANASGAWFAPREDTVSMRAGGGPALEMIDAGWGGGRGMRTITPADQAPKVVTIGHYDAARDYQSGLQRAARPGGGWRERHEELPAVLSAAGAKAVAEATLARGDAERRRRRIACGWEGLALSPGMRVRLQGDATLWRIAGWSLEEMSVLLDLTPIPLVSASVPADAGAIVGAPDRLSGRTILIAAELPPLDDSLPLSPQIVVVAGGTEPGWRGATLMMSTDSGTSWRVAASLRAPGVVGSVVVPPDRGIASIEDRRSSLIVELANDAMTLTGADRTTMDAGANLALVGGELVQFGEVEALGSRRWRLSRLWRGRRGTEAEIATHFAGEAFALLRQDEITMVGVGQTVGAQLLFAPVGVGDDGPLRPVEVALSGRSLVPPSPVHLQVEQRADGPNSLRWVRRSRAGWRWSDGVDAALAEEREHYRIVIEADDGETSAIEGTQRTLSLEGNVRRAMVSQIGTHGASQGRTIMLEE